MTDTAPLPIVDLLTQFRNKGAAWQTESAATSLLIKLKKVLSDDEYWKLVIAHSHYLNGEGAQELYDTCNELINKYKL